MSNYDGYNNADNARRKSNNTGDAIETIGPNQNVKSYSSTPGQLSAQQEAEHLAKKQARLNKRQPVKHYTEEEKAALVPQDVKIKVKTLKHPVTFMEDDEFNKRMEQIQKSVIDVTELAEPKQETIMNEKTVGKYFIDRHGDVYQCVSYCRYPTVTFRKVGSPDVQVGGAVGSPLAESFKEATNPHDLAERIIKQIKDNNE